MEAAMKATLQTCQNKLCKKEMEALTAMTVVHRKKVGALMEKLTSKKIDKDAFEKKVTQLTMEMQNWKESGDVLACSATKCNKEMYNGLNMAVTNMENLCVGKKNCQATISKLRAILDKKNLNVADFKKLQVIIMKYSIKLMKLKSKQT